jgi:type I restriction enzyme S subunit
MEGRWKKGESLPGMPADMWDLWPSELEESEIGKIPKGWFVQQLADVAEILQGSTPNTEVSGYWDPPEHHWVTVKDLSQTQDYVLIGTDRKVSQKGLEYLGSRVVPPRSILLSTGAPIGYVAITTVQTVLGTRVVALQPQSQLGQSYLFHWVKTSVGAFRDAANGTTFPQLLLSTLREFPILAPSAQVLSRFESLLSPIQARVISNVAESSSLAATRDTLLPKLLSGEIRVKVDS